MSFLQSSSKPPLVENVFLGAHPLTREGGGRRRREEGKVWVLFGSTGHTQRRRRGFQEGGTAQNDIS